GLQLPTEQGCIRENEIFFVDAERPRSGVLESVSGIDDECATGERTGARGDGRTIGDIRLSVCRDAWHAVCRHVGSAGRNSNRQTLSIGKRNVWLLWTHGSLLLGSCCCGLTTL